MRANIKDRMAMIERRSLLILLAGSFFVCLRNQNRQLTGFSESGESRNRPLTHTYAIRKFLRRGLFRCLNMAFCKP